MPSQSSHPVAALARELEAQNAERRREARYPTQDPVELEVLSDPGEPIYGTVLDVSRSGLRIAVRQRIDRGEQLKVKLHRNVIVGEVRYCRSVPSGFHVGVKIRDLVRPPHTQDEHIADDQLSIYAVGKGLSVVEIINVREHLAQCEACRTTLAQKGELLNPGGNHRGRLHLRPRD
jgi:PilZ domain